MDVGIIEKTENLGALILQNLKRINGTGCTADVEEYFQKSTSDGLIQSKVLASYTNLFRGYDGLAS
jgi:hypothetical protein